MRKCPFAVAILALVLLPVSVYGQALTSFNGGSLFATFEANGDTVGWSFSVDRAVNVTHMGFWDGDSATAPMTSSHPVGLWDNAGGLIATAIVTPTSTLTSGFRYEPTTVTTIGPGTYSLGAFYSATNPTSDGYMTGTTGITMAAGFTMLNTLRDPSGPQTGLVYPSVTSAAGGRFGPNLLFTEVPEPGAISILAGAGLLLAARRRAA